MNWVIITVNALVFLFEMSLGEGQLRTFFYQYGVVPAYFTQSSVEGISFFWYFPFFSSMFLHGGWMHFLGNMWTLYIFGDNVEDRMGPGRYLLFYLISGLAAGVLHFYLNMYSEVPALGASGAIAGVMGAYMFLFPKSRIIFLFPLFFIPYFIEIPAFFYLGFWFLGELVSGTSFLNTSPGAAGIAFWAHVGGFVAGVLLYRIFLSEKRKPVYRGNSYDHY
jgi:membrane associated rhomboid family serine protease